MTLPVIDPLVPPPPICSTPPLTVVPPAKLLALASAQQLRELLSAVAVYAAGGRKALEDFGQRQGGAALRLTRQFK